MPDHTKGTVPRNGERCLRRDASLELSGSQTNVFRLGTLVTLRDFKLDALTVLQRLVAVHLDGREVDEDVLPPIDGNEAVALLAVEPLDGALCHGALPHFGGAGSCKPP